MNIADANSVATFTRHSHHKTPQPKLLMHQAPTPQVSDGVLNNKALRLTKYAVGKSDSVLQSTMDFTSLFYYGYSAAWKRTIIGIA
ncbi:hypothetical protein CFP56_021892 [Quercus suber]|uniref:Uncharacterized protein n=1 Tax=Quercus suber TaxID=58331 RepID=A0AAW0KDQ4_QUESU